MNLEVFDMLREKRVRLPATTVSVSVEPAADGAAVVVIRFRESPERDAQRPRRPVLTVLDGGRATTQPAC